MNQMGLWSLWALGQHGTAMDRQLSWQRGTGSGPLLYPLASAYRPRKEGAAAILRYSVSCTLTVLWVSWDTRLVEELGTLIASDLQTTGQIYLLPRLPLFPYTMLSVQASLCSPCPRILKLDTCVASQGS